MMKTIKVSATPNESKPTPREVSPEAFGGEAWLCHLGVLGMEGLSLVQRLLETNGRTDAPPEGELVVWGLRSTYTGRWVGMSDPHGNDSLLVFRTHELASACQSDDNSVVWMTVEDWWQKVLDAAETGYPAHVHILWNVDEERTYEEMFRCSDLLSADGRARFEEVVRKDSG